LRYFRVADEERDREGYCCNPAEFGTEAHLI
jgi:hypothetical protein